MKKTLIVGAGGMGRAWASAVLEHPFTELAAWVDVNAETLAAALASQGLPSELGATSLDEALDRIRPDFVIDVTVPEAHPVVTKRCLEDGIPVLGEKPLAHSMEAAREVVRVAKRTGVRYVVSQNRRYNNRFAEFQDLVAQLGPLGMLHADFMIAPHFGGFRDAMESPLLLDMAIHHFDLARAITGRDAVSVYAEEYNPAWSWYAGNAAADALFEMEDGLRFNYRGCWCAEGRPLSWNARWRAAAANGTAEWDGDGSPAGERTLPSGEFFSHAEPLAFALKDGNEGLRASIDSFLTVLHTGEPHPCDAHENIKSLAMVFAAKQSAAEGRRVHLRELLD